MPTEDSFGPDGFPQCHQCGMQRRTDNAAFPGLCAECIAKVPADEQADAIRAAHGGAPAEDAGDDTPADDNTGQ
jgi:hypothetical protein